MRSNYPSHIPPPSSLLKDRPRSFASSSNNSNHAASRSNSSMSQRSVSALNRSSSASMTHNNTASNPSSLRSSLSSPSGDQPSTQSHQQPTHSQQQQQQQQQHRLPYSNLLLAGLDASIMNLNHSNNKAANTNNSSEDFDDEGMYAVPPRPRRLWKVQDTKLPIYPADLYPPPCLQSSCYIADAPPSVIAVRIAECLRRRSVVVEYDEETCTATAMTADRCAFMVRLWRASPQTTTVLVECMRTRGSVQTYHWTVRAILQAAQSLDSGDDTRTWVQTSTSELNRVLLPTSKQNEQKLVTATGQKMDLLPSSRRKLAPSLHTTGPENLSPTSTRAAGVVVVEALEHAWQLLNKDRLEAQQLGMESIVALTDPHCVGLDIALYAALAILGAPTSTTNTNTTTADDQQPPAFLKELHERWFYRLIVKRLLPGEDEGDKEAAAQADAEVNKSVESTGELSGEAATATSSTSVSTSHLIDHHAAVLRSLALVAVTNSLSALAEHQSTILKSILQVQAPQWTSMELLQALTEDLQGSNRPPTVVEGTRLALAHEAVLAVRCLECLGLHSAVAKQGMGQNEATLTLLDGARSIGRSTHEVLFQEASRVYEKLTEEERSC